MAADNLESSLLVSTPVVWRKSPADMALDTSTMCCRGSVMVLMNMVSTMTTTARITPTIIMALLRILTNGS